MSPAGGARRSTRSAILEWTTLGVRVLLAIGFAGSGVMMLTGLGGLGELVDDVGAGPWLRYVIGAAQLAGAVGLVIGPLAGLAAIGLAAIMVGAVFTEIALGAPPVAAVVVLALLAAVAWRLRDRSRGVVGVVLEWVKPGPAVSRR